MAITKISSGVIAGNAIIAAGVAENAISSSEIASNAVGTAQIASGAITSAMLDTNVDIAGTLDVTGVLTADSNVVIAGNLTVNGTTVTNSATNTTIEDALIELGTGTTGTPANDAGIVIERGDSDNAFMGWDESADGFIVGTGSFTGASTGDLTISTAPITTGALTASGIAYPTSDGSSGQYLKTDGAGTLTFANVGAVVNNYTATGDGSTVAFDTGINPQDEVNTWVFVGGVYQPKNTYSYSGSTITFSEAPANGEDIDITTGTVASFDSADTVLGVYQATTTATDAYDTGLSAANENNTFVFLDGVYQPKTSYTFSGSTITFDANTPADMLLEVMATKTLSASAVTTGTIAANAVTSAKIVSDGVLTRHIAANAITGAEISSSSQITASTFTGALTGDVTGNVTGNLTGTVQTAAQTNITSVGTLSALTVSGDLTVDTNTLYVDSTNNLVGIGASSPSSFNTNRNNIVISDNSGAVGLTINSVDTTGSSIISFTDGASGTLAGEIHYLHNDDSMQFKTANTERMRINNSGELEIWHGGTTYYTLFGSNNEINTYSSGGVNSTLYIQHDGGDLNIGNGGLYWDRSASSFGINNTSPSSFYSGADNLVIGSTSENNNGLTIATSNIGVGRIFFADSDSTLAGQIEYAHTANVMVFATAATERVRIDGSGNLINLGTLTSGNGPSTSSIVPANRKAWFQGGGSYFTSYTAGQSTITTDASGLIVGTPSTRSGTANQYTAGISFDHLLNYSTTGNVTYNTYPHAWIGLKTYDFPGYERSSLVLATRSGTDSTSQTNDQLVISPHGEITMPNQPSFSVYINGSNPTLGTSAKIPYDTEEWDTNSDFDTSNSRFVAPVAGKYQFNIIHNTYGVTVGYWFRHSIVVNGTTRQIAAYEISDAATDQTICTPYMANLSAGDYVEIWHSSNDTAVGHSAGQLWNKFQGFLIG